MGHAQKSRKTWTAESRPAAIFQQSDKCKVQRNKVCQLLCSVIIHLTMLSNKKRQHCLQACNNWPMRCQQPYRLTAWCSNILCTLSGLRPVPKTIQKPLFCTDTKFLAGKKICLDFVLFAGSFLIPDGRIWDSGDKPVKNLEEYCSCCTISATTPRLKRLCIPPKSVSEKDSCQLR